jgi:hypothetical protein
MWRWMLAGSREDEVVVGKWGVKGEKWVNGWHI